MPEGMQATFDDATSVTKEQPKAKEPDVKAAVEAEPEPEDTNESEFSEAEELAAKSGWVPQDEWKGNPDEWVTAQQFNFRGELFDKISNLSGDNKALRAQIEKQNEAIRFLAKQEKEARKRDIRDKLDDLKKQKTEAKRSEDSDLETEIDDQILDLKTETKELEKESKEAEKTEDEDTSSAPEMHPDTKAWKDKNTWYGTDVTLTGAVNGLSAEFDFLQQSLGKTYTPKQAIAYVEEKLKERFPDRFGGRRKTNLQTVDGDNPNGSGRNRAKKKYTARDLSPELRSIGQTIVDAKGYESLDAYAADVLGDEDSNSVTFEA